MGKLVDAWEDFFGELFRQLQEHNINRLLFKSFPFDTLYTLAVLVRSARAGKGNGPGIKRVEGERGKPWRQGLGSDPQGERPQLRGGYLLMGRARETRRARALGSVGAQPRLSLASRSGLGITGAGMGQAPETRKQQRQQRHFPALVRPGPRRRAQRRALLLTSLRAPEVPA